MSPRSRSAEPGRSWPKSAACASTPVSRRRALEDGTIVRLALEDALNAVHGARNPVLQRYFVVTPMLAASVVDLLPSRRSDNFEERIRRR